MAGTKYAYVRNFELPDAVLPSMYMLVRIDGKGFHKFSKAHNFAKPNDPQALELMNEAARFVMAQLKGQATMAFGESDEYSFLLRRECDLYSRRVSKITTHIVSLFTSAYLFHWSRYFPNVPLQYPPTFDGRLVPYPSAAIVRDYFSWRQADTHINNLYNTTFWTLIQSQGLSEQEATQRLKGTFSKDKHEILWQLGRNYEKELAIYRKGSTVVWAKRERRNEQPPIHADDDGEKGSAANGDGAGASKPKSEARKANARKKRDKEEASFKDCELVTLHCDIIRDEFWQNDRAATDEERAEGARAIPVDAARSGGDGEDEARGESGPEPWRCESRLRCRGMGALVLVD
ncbi:tRNA-His guanylyltransferase [Thecaphora frezii]